MMKARIDFLRKDDVVEAELMLKLMHYWMTFFFKIVLNRLVSSIDFNFLSIGR